MKKNLLSFIAGILCGVAILYITLLVSGETVTSIAAIDDELSSIPSLSSANPYNHKTEGEKIQHIQNLDEAEFRPASGNNADLYRIKDMCKLRIETQGDDIYSYRTAYFSQNHLIYMFETHYRTSYDKRPDEWVPEFKRVYQEIIFIPRSALVQSEFLKLLDKYITPENRKKC